MWEIWNNKKIKILNLLKDQLFIIKMIINQSQAQGQSEVIKVWDLKWTINQEKIKIVNQLCQHDL